MKPELNADLHDPAAPPVTTRWRGGGHSGASRPAESAVCWEKTGANVDALGGPRLSWLKDDISCLLLQDLEVRRVNRWHQQLHGGVSEQQGQLANSPRKRRVMRNISKPTPSANTFTETEKQHFRSHHDDKLPRNGKTPPGVLLP